MNMYGPKRYQKFYQLPSNKTGYKTGPIKKSDSKYEINTFITDTSN